MAKPPRTRDRVDLWFFVLALVGVTGQVIYSWMLGNKVYFVLNACLVVTNALGLGLGLYRRAITGNETQPIATSGVVSHDGT